jgi:hypothetical protein
VGRKARFRDALKDLQTTLVTAAVRFAVTSTEVVEPLIEADQDCKFRRVFSDGVPKSEVCSLDQIVLAEEGACFLLHVMRRLCLRHDSERCENEIFHPAMREIARTFGSLIARATRRDAGSAEAEMLELVSRRGAEYDRVPTFPGEHADDTRSVASLAAETIANSIGRAGDAGVVNALKHVLTESLAGSALESHVGLLELL